MKVLITGSSGSFGRLLTNWLISKKIEVVGIDINYSKESPSDEYFRFYLCNITDKKALEYIFKEEQPTNVMHFACTFNKVRGRKQEFDIDVGGSRNVLEVSSTTRSVKQFIYSSSAAAYGGNEDNEMWLQETELLRPGHYRYGIIKELIEKAFSETPIRDDLKITALRICTVVGPSFNKPRSVVSILLKFPFLPKFCMENKVQFLHSDDMLSLMDRILNDKEISGVFNLAPDSYAVVKELVPDKKYFRIPLIIIKGALVVLWQLRILNIQPAAVSDSAYPIIIDPNKLVARYGYKFKYSSAEAFFDVARNNRIPGDARFQRI